MRWVHVAGWMLLAAGCSGAEERFVSLPPVPSGTLSLTVVELESEAIRSIELHRLDDQLVVRRSSGEVIIAYYAFALDHLGLEPGKVDLPSFPGDCAFSVPLAIYRLEVAAESDWKLEAGFDELISSALDGPGPCYGCVDYRARAVPIGPTEHETRISIPLPSGAALVDYKAGATTSPEWRLARVDHDRVDFLDGCTTNRLASGAGYGPGQAWLTDDKGRLELVEIDESALRCTVLTSTTVPRRADGGNDGGAWAMDVSDPDEAFEVFIGLSDGTFHRYDGDRFEFVGEVELNYVNAHPDSGAPSSHALSVERVGPGEVYFAAGGPQYGHWILGQGLEKSPIDLTPFASKSGYGDQIISTLSFVSGVGMLAGGPNGEVYRVDRVPRGSSLGVAAPYDVGSIIARGSGFVALLRGGFVAQFHEGGTYCPPATLFQVPGAYKTDGRAAVSLGDEIFVGDFAWNELGTDGVWLSPR